MQKQLSKRQAVITSLLFIQLLFTGGISAQALEVPPKRQLILPDTLLQGHASAAEKFDSSFKAGNNSLYERQFTIAERHFLAAAEELRKRNITGERYLYNKVALGWVYVNLEKPHVALRMFDEALAHCSHSPNAVCEGSALAGAAEALLQSGNLKKAESLAHQAVKVNERLRDSGANLKELGSAYLTLGSIAGQDGYDQESASWFEKAEAIFEQVPGFQQTDLAEALRLQGQEFQRQGKKSESAEAFARMFSILDADAKFDVTPSESSKVKLQWREGGVRSRQLFDPDYPLKYVWINGLRVAVALVRSENVIGALISLSNCSPNRLELSLGQVKLDQLAPQTKPFAYVLPIKLDMALEEEHISALTWRRAWLNHIEKTRRIPGYLKDGVLGVDNFFANNTFGAYGNWGSIAETQTPMVTREQMLYGFMGQKKIGDLASFLSRDTEGMAPTYLDPGDSKTGLVFFGWERFDKARLTIPLGNVQIEMPFDSAGPR